jgi:hypothetical protein
MIGEKRETYGVPKECFDRAAMLAATILDRPVTAYEVVVIMHAVKLARIAQSPMNPDHYVDGINYLAFACEFMSGEPEPPRPPEIIGGRPVVQRAE